MNKKKICFIAQFPPPIHGLSKAVETLYESTLNQEYDFERINITDNRKFIKNLLTISKSNADLFYFTISQTKGGNFRDLIILKLLILQRKKCLVHLHGGYYRTLIDGLNSWQKEANYKTISKAEGAIVLGASLKWIFEGMLPEEKIFIVPNCVDDKYLMSDKEFEKKIDAILDKRIKHVLYLSNFIKSKGYPQILEMAKEEKAKYERGETRNYHFDFAGKFFDEKEKKYFWRFVKDNKLDDYITYHGIVSGEKKRKILQLSDIFVLLTRYPNEGQPISILEAMGNGMIILTTDHAGIPDIVKDGVNGIVLDKNQYENRDYVIGSLYKEINYVDIVYKNRETVINHYCQSKYLSNMGSCFKMLLDQ